MNKQQLWQRYCQFLNVYPELGFSLDISRMRFSDSFLEQMQPRMRDCFSRMKELEQGALANPDEKRMVGHFWLRSPELSPSAEIKIAIINSVKEIKDFAKQIHSGGIAPQKQKQFKNVLLIGIGGSALGPQLVCDALGTKQDAMRIFFCDNTDPDGIARTLTHIGGDLDKTLAIVVSKSGGTLETRNGALEAAHAYQKAGLSFSPHVVAVTCPGSKLDKQAQEEKWLARFPMWDWVGGRTSIFSAVGLLPIALQGIDIDGFLAGAHQMDELTRTSEPLRNPASVLALMWHSAGDGKGKKDMVILPYKDRLMLFSKYLQQLVMESLGKELDLDGKKVNQGIAVYGNKGSTDQHAYIQQLRDGLNNFFVTFVEVLSDYTLERENASHLEVEPSVTSGDYLSGFMLGTRSALYENERDSITITMDTLTPKSLGALIALYDRTVGFYASLVNINAYHQPGVEAGKKAAGKVIDIQKHLLAYLAEQKGNKSGFTAQELSVALSAPDEAETIYKILEHLAANPKRRITRTEKRTPQESRFDMT